MVLSSNSCWIDHTLFSFITIFLGMEITTSIKLYEDWSKAEPAPARCEVARMPSVTTILQQVVASQKILLGGPRA